mmetsp:Transcript_11072/g.43065  ORF Transcript_11072/g.43065 Transcript_11072/m.43065 type:complete len:382 (-) Transcript_11072:501-1646(-)
MDRFPVGLQCPKNTRAKQRTQARGSTEKVSSRRGSNSRRLRSPDALSVERDEGHFALGVRHHRLTPGSERPDLLEHLLGGGRGRLLPPLAVGRRLLGRPAALFGVCHGVVAAVAQAAPPRLRLDLGGVLLGGAAVLGALLVELGGPVHGGQVRARLRRHHPGEVGVAVHLGEPTLDPRPVIREGLAALVPDLLVAEVPGEALGAVSLQLRLPQRGLRERPRQHRLLAKLKPGFKRAHLVLVLVLAPRLVLVLVDGRAPVHAVAPAVDEVRARALVRAPAGVILPVVRVTGVGVAVALLSAVEEGVRLLLDHAEAALVLAVAAAHAAGVGGGHAEQVIAEVEVTPGAVALLLERHERGEGIVQTPASHEPVHVVAPVVSVLR